jgi:hypothetical protein
MAVAVTASWANLPVVTEPDASLGVVIAPSTTRAVFTASFVTESPKEDTGITNARKARAL